jgi:hypothetical protein
LVADGVLVSWHVSVACVQDCLSLLRLACILHDYTLRSRHASTHHEHEGAFCVLGVLLLLAQVIPYNQRLALLLYKLREAVTALGNQQQALALGYAASTMHDVAALHK